MTDREDLRAAARELFADVGERPPGPRRQITLADVEEYSRRYVANRRREPKLEADIAASPDGTPLGVGPATYVFEFNSFAIDQADADRLGIKPGQYPGITIFDPYNREKGNDR